MVRPGTTRLPPEFSVAFYLRQLLPKSNVLLRQCALIASFGSPGRGPGEFLVPHSIRVSVDGRVYVADRENNRVQVFTIDGDFVDQWTDFKCPMGVHIDAEQRVYVTDQVPRISILTLDGELLARGRTFEYAHQVYTDSQGNIYGADTSNQRVQKLVRVR